VDALDIDETYLWTFKGLDAARHLYESAGFVLTQEAEGTQWGGAVVEQRFSRAAR
ncbi:MarR family transcriptional regulator, partial [Paraburkholderia sp. SIMBA_009]